MSLKYLKDIVDSKKFPVTCYSNDEKIDLMGKREKIVTLHNDSGSDIKVLKCRYDNQDGFLNSGENLGYTQICDYIIFIPSDNYIDIALCELKERVGDEEIEKGIKQVLATTPLLCYFLSALKLHHSTPQSKHKRCNLHYFIFATGDKRRQRVNDDDAENECYDRNNKKITLVKSSIYMTKDLVS